jgi:hypothetical protein
MDTQKAQKLAGEISPRAVEIVRAQGGWPKPAKVTLIESASACGAKWMNRFGVSAEYAPEVALGVALVAIQTSRMMLFSELTKLRDELRAEKAAAADKAKHVEAKPQS